MSIHTVGPYHPVRRPQAPVPPVPSTPSYPTNPGTPGGSGVGDFFSDVWVGGKQQFGSNVDKVLHPVRTVTNAWEMIKNPGAALRQIAAPYKQDFQSGNAGRALGRVLANVVTVGGAVLAGRALAGRIGGGGASVGTSGPLSGLFNGVGNAVGSVARGVGNVFGFVTRPLGAAFRWLFTGGGASVGFR